MSRVRSAVVFDCDGLLLDTERVWMRAEEEWLASYGKPYTEENRRMLLGASGFEAGAVLASIVGRPGEEWELYRELRDLARPAVVAGAEPMPGAAKLVENLRGKVPLGVASNSPGDLARDALQAAGLLDAFAVVLGADEVSRPKPAPDLYLAACEKLGAEPKFSVALEDSPTGARAARAAGMYVVGVPSESDFEADLLARSLEEPSVLRTVETFAEG